MKGLNKALFLDLDGTIVKVKSGETFSKTVNDWEFIDGVLASIKRFSERGYIICIVCNQGGIELGKVTEEFIDTKINSIRVEIEAYINNYVYVAYCRSMEHYDRKPNPGMAYYFARELSLNLRDSIMVGDQESDHAFQINAGIGAFLRVEQFAETLITE
jgi:D-glycero-D-manno-heptose 1,7-bisphosphate phosphatase